MLKKVRNRRDDALSRVSWPSFETLLAAHYRAQGYRVDHVGSGSGVSRYDGGVDLELRRNDEFVLVQCKHWNARQVPHNAVHELLGVMLNRGATAAIVVCSGEFTNAARDAARLRGQVQLVDGEGLRAMLGPLAEAAVDDSAADARGLAQRGFEMGGLRPSRASRRERSRPRLGVRLAAVFSFTVMVVAALAIFSGLRDFRQSLTRPPDTPAHSVTAPTAPAAVLRVSALAPPARSRAPMSVAEPALRAAELRAWQRRSAASMKVLEKTTPAMP